MSGRWKTVARYCGGQRDRFLSTKRLWTIRYAILPSIAPRGPELATHVVLDYLRAPATIDG